MKVSYQDIGQKLDATNQKITEYQTIFNQLGSVVNSKGNAQPLFDQIDARVQSIQESIIEIKDLELRNVDKATHQKWITEAKDYLDSIYEHTFLTSKVREHYSLGFFKKLWKVKEIAGIQQRLQEVSNDCIVKAEKYNKSVKKVLHR